MSSENPSPTNASSSAPEKHESEPQNEGMVVKPVCDCSTCHHWINSADWTTENQLQFECPKAHAPRQKVLQPLMRSEKHPGKKPTIKMYRPDRLTKLEKQTIFKTLVHGEAIPEPVSMFTHTYFSADVQKSLEALNYRYSLPLQSFAWAAIFRQMNVFVIGAPKSGKTISYLPAVCTFCTSTEEKYEQLAKHKGPLVVIICPNSKRCEQIYDLIKKFYSDVKTKIRISIITYPATNVHNTDILITIPDSLTHCLKTRMFNLKRLCHLVLEDASVLLKNHEDSIYQILKVSDEMLEHRANNAKVQLILTSEKWTSDLQKLLKSLYVTPLVCVENFLEAALYGNINFEVKFLMSGQKMAYLEGVLKDNYRFYKTIVICDGEELCEVNKWLVRNGIETVALSDESSLEDAGGCEVEWSFMQGGEYKVLLCTDFVFDSLLCVNDAMWLINYSFPSTWTRFTKRFSALSTHYKSSLDSNENGIECKTFLLIDETCENRMQKILHLLGRLSKDLPPNYQTYADGFRTKTEQEKIDNRVDLCETLKLFGKCSNTQCEKRHLVNEEVDTCDDLPKRGKVRFRILNMRDVTRCTVQLTEHVDLDGRVTRINDDDLRKPLVFGEKKRPGKIEVGGFYAHCENTTEGEVYRLCHVLSVDKEKVEVKLTTELTLQTFTNKLFEVPADVKIVDVYFCNLIPPFGDEHFSGRSFFVAHSSLERLEYKKMLLTGTIHLQLDRTLWLDDVGQIFNLEDTEVVKFNLTKHLVHLQVVEHSKSQISELHKLCTRCDIVLPTYIRRMARKPVKQKEIEPQRAFLDDNVNEVFFSSAVSPDEFYVRLAKFHSLLTNLEKDIQASVNTTIPDKPPKVEIGKYYLAPDPRGEAYSRARILNVENSKVLVFYVDYGDEAVVDVATIRILPSKFLSLLPFQAIQCRLYGLCPSFGEWDDEATDVLYNYVLEPDSDFFRSLYVTAVGKDDSDAVRAKVKYSVLLKDGYGDKNTLLNQLLLDCGFATSIFEKIEDFEIPKIQEEEGSGSEGEVDEVVENGGGDVEFDDDDFVIDDPLELLRMLGYPDPRKLTPPTTRSLTYSEHQSPIDLTEPPTSSTNEKSPYLTPEIYWSQTDTELTIKIQLVDVTNYKVNLVQKKIFTFGTTLNDKRYELKFVLCKPAEVVRHFASGQEIRVFLRKMEAGEWQQLTGTSKRLRYVHYAIPDDQLKEVKRRFLQLDITDDESDGDEDGPMVHEFSDLDSEFDQEIDSSDLD